MSILQKWNVILSLCHGCVPEVEKIHRMKITKAASTYIIQWYLIFRIYFIFGEKLKIIIIIIHASEGEVRITVPV